MDALRIVVTGDREWPHPVTGALRIADAERGPLVRIAHGDAPGADSIAAKCAAFFDPRPAVIPYPADWDRFGRAAGPIRNGDMLKREAELARARGDRIEVHAFHPNLRESRGTRDCVLKAARAGLTVCLWTRPEDYGEETR